MENKRVVSKPKKIIDSINQELTQQVYSFGVPTDLNSLSLSDCEHGVKEVLAVSKKLHKSLDKKVDVTIASYLARARVLHSDKEGNIDAKEYKKFLKSVGVSQTYAHDLSKFYKFKEEFAKVKIANPNLKEPETEFQHRALKGKTTEEKADHFNKACEVTGKDQPSAKEIKAVELESFEDATGIKCPDYVECDIEDYEDDLKDLSPSYTHTLKKIAKVFNTDQPTGGDETIMQFMTGLKDFMRCAEKELQYKKDLAEYSNKRKEWKNGKDKV